jgi:hypothetical protein
VSECKNGGKECCCEVGKYKFCEVKWQVWIAGL